MRYLTALDASVSELGLGFWSLSGPFVTNGITLGWPTMDEADVRAIVREAVDLGVNFFDTSSIYGGGLGERLIARCGDILGRDAIICTKGGLNDGFDAPTGKIPRRFDADTIEEQLDASLRRLERPRVDVYLLHGATRQSLADGALWEALVRVRQSGKVGALGVSVRRSGMSDADYMRLVTDNEAIGVVEMPVSPINPGFVAEWGDKLSATKLVVARSPYYHGLLTRPADAGFHADDNRATLVGGDVDAARAVVERAASRFGVDTSGLLIAYALRLQPAVCLTGARKAGQLSETAARAARRNGYADAVEWLVAELTRPPVAA